MTSNKEKLIENTKTDTNETASVKEHEALLKKAIEGDKYAFGILYREYRDEIFRHLYRMVSHRDDAMDLVTDTFVKAWKSIGKFRSDSSLKTWLYKIATNVAIDHLRKRRFIEVPLNIIHNLSQPDTDYDAMIDEERMMDNLEQAMKTLSPKEKACFTLRFLEEKSIAETAQIMDISEGTVKSLYFRAMKKLKKKLSGIMNLKD